MSLDPEDLFADSLQSLYDYTPISLSSAGSFFEYTPPETKGDSSFSSSSRTVITLKTPEPQANNWSLHASSIWTSSIFLADHVDDLHIVDLLAAVRQHDVARPLRILELGAAAGLPSIRIAALYGSDVQVVVSDYPDPDLIRTLEENILLNQVSHNCRAVPYAWGTDTSILTQVVAKMTIPHGVSDGKSSGFDLIVAADTLWNSDSHRPFLQTITCTLSHAAHARILLIAGLHTGRYTLESFLGLLPPYGLEVATLEERSVDGLNRRKWDVERAEGEDDRERRKWLLWMSLKRTRKYQH